MDTLDEETSPAFMDVTNYDGRVLLSKNVRLPLLKLKVVGGPSYG